MKKQILLEYIREAFGEEIASANEKIGAKIGAWKGNAPVGAPSLSEDEEGICPMCRMMTIHGECECSRNSQDLSKTTDESSICSECGMMEVEGSCGCAHLDEVAPEGGEHVVKALKKEPGVENPWAVAWSMKNKGYI